jgi:hypothetical protein
VTVRKTAVVPYVAFSESPGDPGPPRDPVLDRVGAVLDPVLVPLGFAEAQLGSTADEAQVIFCRGDEGSIDDGCIDLVVDLAAAPAWHIVDLRYWGFPNDRWHLEFPRGVDLEAQLAALAHSLPHTLAEP